MSHFANTRSILGTEWEHGDQDETVLGLFLIPAVITLMAELKKTSRDEMEARIYAKSIFLDLSEDVTPLLKISKAQLLLERPGDLVATLPVRPFLKRNLCNTSVNLSVLHVSVQTDGDLICLTCIPSLHKLFT